MLIAERSLILTAAPPIPPRVHLDLIDRMASSVVTTNYSFQFSSIPVIRHNEGIQRVAQQAFAEVGPVRVVELDKLADRTDLTLVLQLL